MDHQTHNDHEDAHEDFGGLRADLHLTRSAITRRTALRAAASLGALSWLGCSTPTDASDDPSNNGTCRKIPSETAGPFPGDGSNGPNVLSQTGVVRSDIRSSFAGLSGSANGVLLNVALTIVSSTTCSPLANRAVYLWHADILGRYSLYSTGVTNQNYLRGVQETDSNGRLNFITIFPGCYDGRWPHIHFEVYPSLAAAANVANKIATSQIALPKSACDVVYATTGYAASVSSLSRVSLTTDNVFSDGASLELATVTGDVSAGMTATLSVAV